MKFILSALIFILITGQAFPQNDGLKKLTFSAYGELYYSFDFSRPQNHEKPPFLYNHKRHNELNANLLMVKAAFQEKKYRANLGIMAGNYTAYNLSAEPTWAQFIYEANLGVKLSNKQNLWLDAGIMPSHIGFESALSADCWTLTRSLLAENSPYYEAGIRFSYTSKNEKLLLSALYLNGWQRIRKPGYIQRPSFGTQVTFKPNGQVTFNYSSFLGTDKPDSIKAFRQYHNFYLIYEPTNKFGVIAGFDLGRDKYNATQYGIWYSPVLIIRCRLNNSARIAFRSEYYHDPKQIIITTGTDNWFQTLRLTSNFQFDITKKLAFRFEAKLFHSRDSIFSSENNNPSLTANLTLKL